MVIIVILGVGIITLDFYVVKLLTKTPHGLNPFTCTYADVCSLTAQEFECLAAAAYRANELFASCYLKDHPVDWIAIAGGQHTIVASGTKFQPPLKQELHRLAFEHDAPVYCYHKGDLDQVYYDETVYPDTFSVSPVPSLEVLQLQLQLVHAQTSMSGMV